MSKTDKLKGKNLRLNKGLTLSITRNIEQISQNTFRIESQTNKSIFYQINYDLMKCNCKDNEIRKIKCKHLYAIESYVVQKGENRINNKTIKTWKDDDYDF